MSYLGLQLLLQDSLLVNLGATKWSQDVLKRSQVGDSGIAVELDAQQKFTADSNRPKLKGRPLTHISGLIQQNSSFIPSLNRWSNRGILSLP